MYTLLASCTRFYQLAPCFDGSQPWSGGWAPGYLFIHAKFLGTHHCPLYVCIWYVCAPPSSGGNPYWLIYYYIGAVWMSWVQIFVFRNQLHGPLKTGDQIVFAIAALIYGLLVAGVAIDFPYGTYGTCIVSLSLLAVIVLTPSKPIPLSWTTLHNPLGRCLHPSPHTQSTRTFQRWHSYNGPSYGVAILFR